MHQTKSNGKKPASQSTTPLSEIRKPDRHKLGGEKTETRDFKYLDEGGGHFLKGGMSKSSGGRGNFRGKKGIGWELSRRGVLSHHLSDGSPHSSPHSDVRHSKRIDLSTSVARQGSKDAFCSPVAFLLAWGKLGFFFS